jgi:hypothetical protein
MKNNQHKRDECLARAREIIAEYAQKYSLPVEEFCLKYGWEEPEWVIKTRRSL